MTHAASSLCRRESCLGCRQMKSQPRPQPKHRFQNRPQAPAVRSCIGCSGDQRHELAGLWLQCSSGIGRGSTANPRLRAVGWQIRGSPHRARHGKPQLSRSHPALCNERVAPTVSPGPCWFPTGDGCWTALGSSCVSSGRKLEGGGQRCHLCAFAD